MNQVLFLRNFLIFAVFVLLLFITPFVFAATRSSTITLTDGYLNGEKQEVSVPLYLQTAQGNTSVIDLTSESNLRLPYQVVKLMRMSPNLKAKSLGDPGVLSDLVELWTEHAGKDPDGDGKAVPKLRKSNETLMFPICYENAQGKCTIGYTDLAGLAENQELYRTYGTPKPKVHQTSFEPPFAGAYKASGGGDYGSVSYGSSGADMGFAGSDVTLPDDPISEVVPAAEPQVVPIPRPQMRSQDVEQKADRQRSEQLERERMEQAQAQARAQNSAILNCSNTPRDYRLASQKFQNISCLKGMNFVKRAELIMQDILYVNAKRGFHLDPRFSVCIGWAESNMHPNAKGASGEHGMYQMMPGTLGNAIQTKRPIVPGFENIRNKDTYAREMIKSTKAQADPHHTIVWAAAKSIGSSTLARFNNGTATYNDWEKVGNRYNGGASSRGERNGRARGYGKKIANCIDKMKTAATRSGRVTNEGQLKAALNTIRKVRE